MAFASLDNLEQKIALFKQQYQQLKAEKAELSTQLKQLREELVDKGKLSGEIDHLQNQISERDGRIEQLQNELGDKNGHIEHLQNELGERDGRLAEQDQRINELQNSEIRLREIEQQFDQMSGEHHEVQDKLENLLKDLDEIDAE